MAALLFVNIYSRGSITGPLFLFLFLNIHSALQVKRTATSKSRPTHLPPIRPAQMPCNLAQHPVKCRHFRFGQP